MEPTDGTMVDPELRRHAVSKKKEETDILKEQRKYMEEVRERDKARKDNKGGKGDAAGCGKTAGV